MNDHVERQAMAAYWILGRGLDVPGLDCPVLLLDALPEQQAIVQMHVHNAP